MRGSNHLVGVVNFITFLLSIPILGGGIWLSTQANSTDCMRFLQWPLIIIGASLMIVSLAGFAGSCYRNTFLMYFYLWAMFFIIAGLLGFVIFAFAVTDKGSGRPVMNRAYLDYSLEDYSGWLVKRVSDNGYWIKIATCIRDSRVCSKLSRVDVNGVPESSDDFYRRKLSPIQSGCCKPPTDCGFVYVNETFWSPGGGLVGANQDCSRWTNDQRVVCYLCGSCRAGVLASLKHSWRKVSIINIVVLILLVIFYVVAYAALRNNKRMDNDESYGETRMTKSHPTAMHF